MKKAAHLTGKDLMGMCQVRPGDLGKYALIPGPVDRAQAILKNIENPVKNFSFFEYSLYTGNYAQARVSVGNGGRFSSDSAIIAEILCNAGVDYIIRAGSCGALTEEIGIGDIVIADEIIRGDGVTPYYVDSNFKTRANPEVVAVLKKAAEKSGVRVHTGPLWTTDALLRETREIVEKYQKMGAVAVDMVSSSMLTIAQLYNKKAASIMAVSDNVETGAMGFMDMNYYMAEQNVIKIVLEAVKMMEGKQ